MGVTPVCAGYPGLLRVPGDDRWFKRLERVMMVGIVSRVRLAVLTQLSHA
jgi:hypothetical protein